MSDPNQHVISAVPTLIGGTGRSGTTLMSRILGEHPDVFAFRWETQFLVAPGGLFELQKRHFAETAFDSFEELLLGRWLRRLVRAGTPEAYEAGLIDDMSTDAVSMAVNNLRMDINLEAPENAAIRSFVRSLVRAALEHHGLDSIAAWAEKTPRNCLYLPELAQVFPDMRFIHVIRDGRDVASSMVSRGFWPIAPGGEPSLQKFRGDVTIRKALKYWHTIISITRRRAARLPVQSYIEIRLEDLVDCPRTTLDHLCRFLGLKEFVDLRSFNLDNSNSGRWRRDFTPADIDWARRHMGDTLADLGYDDW